MTDEHRADAITIWDYHQMHHPIRPVSAGIGLGSHDLGVAAFAAQLYHQGLFPTLVFSGANSPTTAARFPRGEAVHFAEHAIELGVPEPAIIVEPRATNTGQNIDYARVALADVGVTVESVLLNLQALHGTAGLRHGPDGLVRCRGRLRVRATDLRGLPDLDR